MTRTTRKGMVLFLLLALTQASASAGEPGWKRSETLFVISLPFTAVTGFLLTEAAAMIIQGNWSPQFTEEYQIAMYSTAILGSCWIAWYDAETAGRPLSGMGRDASLGGFFALSAPSSYDKVQLAHVFAMDRFLYRGVAQW